MYNVLLIFLRINIHSLPEPMHYCQPLPTVHITILTFSSFRKLINIALNCVLSLFPALTPLSDKSTSFAIRSHAVPPATVFSRLSRNSCASRLSPHHQRSSLGGGREEGTESLAQPYRALYYSSRRNRRCPAVPSRSSPACASLRPQSAAQSRAAAVHAID